MIDLDDSVGSVKYEGKSNTNTFTIPTETLRDYTTGNKIFQYRLTVESPYDKTNKMTVHPLKTQISLGIHPVWSGFRCALSG